MKRLPFLCCTPTVSDRIDCPAAFLRSGHAETFRFCRRWGIVRWNRDGEVSRVSTRITGRGFLCWVPPRSARTESLGGTGTADICHFKGDAMSLRRLLIGAASGGNLLQAVLVMRPTEDRLSLDFTPFRQSMSATRSQPQDGCVLIISSSVVRRDSWSQAQGGRPRL